MQKKLDKIITELKDNYTSKEFKPKPTPLCYWCPYNKQSCIKDKENEMLCEYYSLWTPTEKTFAVNKPWNVIEGSVPVAKAKKTETKEFIW